MKKLGIIRIVIQISFIILTIARIRLTPMTTSKFITFGLIFVFGAFYCSWVCAFGSIQEYIRKFGKKYIKKTIIIPQKINRILLYFRYIPIFFMLLYITGVFDKITELTDGRKIFLSLISGRTVTITLIVIMLSFLVLSLFIDRPFCKYFCQEGARYGIFGMSRLVMIERDKETCVNCGLCTKNAKWAWKLLVE
ncbi:4Fe-4S binding protein [Fusobacterium sp. PH5-44]|uniref:4Fe-4S binding protein n=1 Tax=unclassified Fusobacterium TaxID=2648384 RepID=UPI003D200507